jgi:transposase-like protein
MYRDVAQWCDIRDRVLRKGVSIRQVARETGISSKTVRKMLDHLLPQPHRPRRRRYPRLGPHIGTIQRLLRENATLPPSARLSIKAIYERVCGSYTSVTDYVSTAVENQATWRRDSGQFSAVFCQGTAYLFGQGRTASSSRPAVFSRRAQRRSRRPEGPRVAARSVLDGREHDGTLAAGGRARSRRRLHLTVVIG